MACPINCRITNPMIHPNEGMLLVLRPASTLAWHWVCALSIEQNCVFLNWFLV